MNFKCIKKLKQFSQVIEIFTFLIIMLTIGISSYYLYLYFSDNQLINTIIFSLLIIIGCLIVYLIGYTISNVLYGFAIIVQNSYEEITKRNKKSVKKETEKVIII